MVLNYILVGCPCDITGVFLFQVSVCKTLERDELDHPALQGNKGQLDQKDQKVKRVNDQKIKEKMKIVQANLCLHFLPHQHVLYILCDQAIKIDCLNIKQAQQFQLSVKILSSIHRIVSEKLCMKNSKLYKECMGSLTFLPPSNFAGPTLSLLYIGNAFYGLTRMLISKHVTMTSGKIRL